MENFEIIKRFSAKTKKLFLDLFFPKSCFGCKKSGSYLCVDCLALIDFPTRIIKENGPLSRLYYASDYKNFLVQGLIRRLKYRPFAKELARPLSFIIIAYFKNLEKPPCFLSKKQGFFLIPIPLSRRKLRQRGFNQAQEIAKLLSGYLDIPLVEDGLIKIKNTTDQTNLSGKEREKNIKGVFACPQPGLVKERKILLIDDVFTTGATMKEAASVLKNAGAKQVWGIVAARG